MKISGTSLMPAARPTPAPFHRRWSGWHMSQAMSAISTSSIWPTWTERSTGSVHSATADTVSTAAPRRWPCQPSWPNVTQTVAIIAARLATAISHFSTAQGSSDPAANPSAANGV